MAKVKTLDAPSGWLMDPHKKWAIHFEGRNDSQDNSTATFTIDMWGVGPDGQPMKFKSRRKATFGDCIKTRDQLISSDWTMVDSINIKSA
tara:strand:+ start:219 stop:488 length:270 start_codon:yes stop_codon:yes gene_type:complete